MAELSYNYGESYVINIGIFFLPLRNIIQVGEEANSYSNYKFWIEH